MDGMAPPAPTAAKVYMDHDGLDGHCCRDGRFRSAVPVLNPEGLDAKAWPSEEDQRVQGFIVIGAENQLQHISRQ